MAVGSGLAQLGYQSALAIAKETAFGTFVTATSFIEFNSESFKFSREEIKLEAINSTRDFKKRLIGKETVEGALEGPLNVASDGIVNIIKQAMGGSVASTALSTTAFKHVLSVGNMEDNASTGTDDMKSLSVVVRKGDTNTWDAAGMRVNTLTIKGEVGGVVTFNAEMVGQSMSITSTCPAITLSDVLPVNFTGISIKTGISLTTSLTAECFTGFEFTINNNLDADQRCLGTRNIAILPPIRREVMIKLSQRFDTLTSYSRALENTVTAIQIILDTDTAIADATTYSMAIDLPSVYFNSNMPEVGDIGVLNVELEGTCMYNSATSNVLEMSIYNATTDYL